MSGEGGRGEGEGGEGGCGRIASKEKKPAGPETDEDVAMPPRFIMRASACEDRAASSHRLLSPSYPRCRDRDEVSSTLNLHTCTDGDVDFVDLGFRVS